MSSRNNYNSYSELSRQRFIKKFPGHDASRSDELNSQWLFVVVGNYLSNTPWVPGKTKYCMFQIEKEKNKDYEQKYAVGYIELYEPQTANRVRSYLDEYEGGFCAKTSGTTIENIELCFKIQNIHTKRTYGPWQIGDNPITYKDITIHRLDKDLYAPLTYRDGDGNVKEEKVEYAYTPEQLRFVSFEYNKDFYSNLFTLNYSDFNYMTSELDKDVDIKENYQGLFDSCKHTIYIRENKIFKRRRLKRDVLTIDFIESIKFENILTDEDDLEYIELYKKLLPKKWPTVGNLLDNTEWKKIVGHMFLSTMDKVLLEDKQLDEELVPIHICLADLKYDPSAYKLLDCACKDCITDVVKCIRDAIPVTSVVNIILQYLVTPWEFYEYKLPSISEEQYLNDYTITRENFTIHYIFATLMNNEKYNEKVIKSYYELKEQSDDDETYQTCEIFRPNGLSTKRSCEINGWRKELLLTLITNKDYLSNKFTSNKVYGMYRNIFSPSYYFDIRNGFKPIKERMSEDKYESYRN